MEFQEKINTYFNQIKETLDSLDKEEIKRVIFLLSAAHEQNRQIFICGNGGSAMIASHIACDLNKGVSCAGKKRFKVIPLTDNIATITAYANDVSYEDIFVEQLKNLFEPKDVVIGISASGNSSNVIKAIEYTNAHGGVSVGLCGFDGGQLRKKAAHSILVSKDDMQVVEDIHSILGHMLMKIFIDYK